MSTTPALARATEEVKTLWLHEEVDLAAVAHAALSAALHVPSVQRRVHDALYTVPADDLLDKQPGETYHDHAERVAAWAVDAVRAAILGGA
ncbi:hypothetical protein [Cellulosimicrobium cellulans]|uniref:hypothetical protein n=1 Tax=Cellulosimicrobium cellulans TaxID=1710 RepID=UPI001BA7EDAB|nr:hypothetical protein [Cellulosimicrobium cellulans]QUC01202.1 hypothetical protein J5A69_08590 [Cellulosimicrobium cellulans]